MSNILIVDDDDALRGSLVRCLKAKGHHVESAASPDEALEHLAKQDFEVMVTDLCMNPSDGVQLIRMARDVSPETTPILMSGSATAREQQAAQDLGAVRVLCKPFSSQELAQSIVYATECKTGFRGHLYGLSLIDVLQMFHYGRRTVRLSIRGLIPGFIQFAEGEIVDAAHGSLQGEPALQSLLAQTSGFIDASPAVECNSTVTRPFQALLLDLLRLLDEGTSPLLAPVPEDEIGDWTARPSTLFPPPNEEDEGRPSHVEAIDIGVAIQRLGARTTQVIETVSGEGSQTMLAFVQPSTGAVTSFMGRPVPPEELVASTRHLTRALDRFDPEWVRHESFQGSVAVGLVRCDRFGGFLLVTEAFVGDYPVAKFRVQLAKIANLAQDPESWSNNATAEVRRAG